jgi:hypothetical protein
VYQRNLDAIVHLLGDGSPEASPLLKWASNAHGAQQSNSLRPRQIQLLAEWTADVTGYSAMQQPSTDGIDESTKRSAAAQSPTKDPSNGFELEHDLAEPASHPHSGTDARMPTFEEMNSLDWSAMGRQTPESTPRRELLPRDPFDPAIFNQHYGPHGLIGDAPGAPESQNPSRQ